MTTPATNRENTPKCRGTLLSPRKKSRTSGNRAFGLEPRSSQLLNSTSACPPGLDTQNSRRIERPSASALATQTFMIQNHLGARDSEFDFSNPSLTTDLTIRNTASAHDSDTSFPRHLRFMNGHRLPRNHRSSALAVSNFGIVNRLDSKPTSARTTSNFRVPASAPTQS